MSKTVIKVKNLSKQYRLGLVGTGTLSHDINRWWHLVRGKEDPYLKIGETNDRASKGNSEYVWALRDINFEVKEGEVLGIIGKNGAGKSTLLKLLSKVTAPTTGSIKAKGRIASLLEVGTGFHPELTGRENIFLNGTILGMTKAEVGNKLDEIVAFAGVERYLDTPVKRYSSGMKVRLGFAVAAHLEPEILIVDEVLAVGDAEFQKKAIGKMQEVSYRGGRTVLFVSHNMESIQLLCDKAILLNKGQTKLIGSTDLVLDKYFEEFKNSHQSSNLPISDGNITIKEVETKIRANNLDFIFKIKTHDSFPKLGLGFKIKTDKGQLVSTVSPSLTNYYIENVNQENLVFRYTLENFSRCLPGGDFSIDTWLSIPRLSMLCEFDNIHMFSIQGPDIYQSGRVFNSKKHGLNPLYFNFSYEKS